jgi:putative component of membrane protein insertase Oxa1/YidC/SpoIIIJ protein YidD
MLKKVCSDCPFKQECQEYALAHERHGFWAGMTTFERDRVRKIKRWGLVPVEYIWDFFINNNLNAGTQTK